jgi:hypothetical protein
VHEVKPNFMTQGIGLCKKKKKKVLYYSMFVHAWNLSITKNFKKKQDG